MNAALDNEGRKAEAGLTDLAGKYLTFSLGAEIYGLEILKVSEIIGLMSITRVPQTPAYIRGVINLRGKVIPVVELRKKFDLDCVEDTERTCIIVVQVIHADQPIIMGILVDEVSEVVDISGPQLEPPPNLGAAIDTNYIRAMGKVGNHVVILLDVDRVLTTGELATVSGMSE